MEKFGKVCKEYMVKELAEHFKDYPDFFVVSFSRVSVGNTEKFRKALKKDSTAYSVVKNSILKRAIEESRKDVNGKEIKAFITGSCGVLFSKGEPTASAKSLVNFSKDNKNVKIQGGFVSGDGISVDLIEHLATLPSREVLLSMFASGVKAPISGFVSLLNNLLRNLVGVIDAISKKKAESQ